MRIRARPPLRARRFLYLAPPAITIFDHVNGVPDCAARDPGYAAGIAGAKKTGTSPGGATP
jgi:hypothetical protein